jgi:hypothetical protein
MNSYRRMSYLKIVWEMHLFQLPSHLWNGINDSNSPGFSQTLKVIWLKPISILHIQPSHKWDGN